MFDIIEKRILDNEHSFCSNKKLLRNTIFGNEIGNSDSTGGRNGNGRDSGFILVSSEPLTLSDVIQYKYFRQL